MQHYKFTKVVCALKKKALFQLKKYVYKIIIINANSSKKFFVFTDWLSPALKFSAERICT